MLTRVCLASDSCKSAALLSDHELDSEIVIAAEKFGYHFGLAFQVLLLLPTTN